MPATQGESQDPGRQNADQKQTAFGIPTLVKMPGSWYQPRQKRGERAAPEIDADFVDFDDVGI